jgi:thymidine kinase
MNKENDRQIKISVEGNIASGKTTIIKYLDKCFGNKRLSSNKIVRVYPEPVEKWCNLNGENLLDLLYSDPARWAFTLQSYVQLTMLEEHLKDSDNKSLIKVMERSLFSARYCFVENLYKRYVGGRKRVCRINLRVFFVFSGLVKQSEYDVLSKWFEWIVSNNNCDLDLVFYLRTDPEICYKRAHVRNRKEEVGKGLSLEYLENLHSLHEEWLTTGDKNKSSSPKVILIDANQSIDDVCKRIYKEANVLFR